MAKSQESFQKRAREKARQEKRAEKRARKEARSDETPEPRPVNEDALMEEFATLNQRHESGQVSLDEFEKQRHRIFVELGIEEED